MKWKLLAVTLLIFFAGAPSLAFADAEQQLQDSVIDALYQLDFTQFDALSQDFFGSVASKIMQIVNGDFEDAQTFLQLILQMSGQVVCSLLPQLISLAVVLVVLGLLRNVSGGLVSLGTDKVITFVGVCVILSSLLSVVIDLHQKVFTLLEQISMLAQASMPILLTLIVANGGNALSGVCQPSMVMYCTFVLQVVQKVIFPLTVFSLVFAVVNNVSRNIRVGKMAEFFKSSASWTLGVVFMFFSALTTLQGISASSIDGISVRAIKFATKSYVPILGGYLADGFDMIVASTTLIKNAFGICSLIVLLNFVLSPLVSIICVNLGLQAVGALCEPIVQPQYVNVLSVVSKSLSFLAILVIAVAFMFSILILVAICCANAL